MPTWEGRRRLQPGRLSGSRNLVIGATQTAAMCGSDTFAMDVSNNSMKVARVKVRATTQG